MIELTTLEIDLLCRIGDVLLPPEAGLPPPSRVLRDGRLLEVAVKARRDHADHVRRACAALAAPTPEAVGRLFADEPEIMGDTANIVAGAYFMDEGVRSAIRDRCRIRPVSRRRRIS
jgi:hypothetical protein